MVYEIFSERVALKIRLEQMADAESKVIREFQREREFIYARLRELDEQDQVPGSSIPPDTDDRDSTKLSEGSAPEVLQSAQEQDGESQTTGDPLNDNRSRLKRSDANQLYDVAVQILKEQTAAIPASDLKKEITIRTGHRITNFSNFADRLLKRESAITRPIRGHYFYDNELAESNNE